jgi:hypothetical protein
MNKLLKAIVDEDWTAVNSLLKGDPGLVTQSIKQAKLYRSKIFHWMYVGDTALHLAAAGHRAEIVRRLIEAGADPNAAKNHRASRPLHYAADGCPGGPIWDAKNQVATIRVLLDHGADLHAQDKNGATALHRSVRTRCAEAVRCLLKAGSDPTTQNKPGSTPFHLAVQNTGRGGSGLTEAIEAQREIIEVFLEAGVSPDLKCARGKSVRDWARSQWIAKMLETR